MQVFGVNLRGEFLAEKLLFQIGSRQECHNVCAKGASMKMMMGILTAALLMNLFSVLAHAENIQPTSVPACVLASEGLATNAWVQHRILIADKAIYGANDMGSIAVKLQTLRQLGVCH